MFPHYLILARNTPHQLSSDGSALRKLARSMSFLSRRQQTYLDDPAHGLGNFPIFDQEESQAIAK